MNKTINITNDLQDGLITSFIDSKMQSNLSYRSEFLSNNYEKGRKVLVTIEDELSKCDEFKISVAFITKSGITPLLQVLKELESKNIPGKILTTDYLAFSEPEALEKLASLKNIELRMYRTNDDGVGFHTKGYIFHRDELYRVIIGSSNMTLSAVTKNKEWNTKVVSTSQGEMINEILNEFDELWNDNTHTFEFEDFIDDYKLEFLKMQMIKKQHKAALESEEFEYERYNLVPNKMQVAFVNNIIKMREEDVEKALLLSATGTGKSYASAFAMRELKPSKMLFLVHREQIAKQALKSYKKVFGESKTYGLLSGNFKDMDAEFLFSTMQMMSKQEIYEQFDPKEFDVIVLDECHHAGAVSYQKILNYFKPKFCLGMTASPDTNNYDIYSLFDHNIAYEIRLQQALELDLLCPFHYFGITDLEINGEVFDDSTGLKNFKYLVSSERAKYVIEKAEYFGYSGDRVKGLIFCSRKEEAYELSEQLNMLKKPNGEYYKTAVLTGEDNQEKREEIIDRLTVDNNSDKQIDYILTVDIFNEGVDIPEINQVIMLRPTQSPVIFVQQLGRGLRKYQNKEYVVIIDFIGNYTNNFMIPIALSGDRSYNKDSMRRYIMEGTRIIPGSSTVHFDEISKKRIYDSIDKAKTNDNKLILDSYTQLKNKLGRIPTILEFEEFGSIDIEKIFVKFDSYYSFLKKYEDDYKIELTSNEENVIKYLSKKVCSFKRPYEADLLLQLINMENRRTFYLRELLESQYHCELSNLVEESVYNNLSNQFLAKEMRKTYYACTLIKKNEDGSCELTDSFKEMIKNNNFKDMVIELLTYAHKKYDKNYSNKYKDTDLQLYQKYTYEDVCRLLCYKENVNGQSIGGYKYDNYTKTLPVFINYQKAENAISYEDRFISEDLLIALSKKQRSIGSNDYKHIYKIGEEEKDNRIFLFVRKNKDDKEAKEFYFLGEIFAQGDAKEICLNTDKKEKAFEILYKLDVPVRSDIYDYIVEK